MFGSHFWRHRIDIKARPPFEAGNLGQFRNDLNMPVIVAKIGFLNRR